MPEISPAAMKFLRQRVNLRHLQKSAEIQIFQ
jgi:hypothetical protein